MSCCISEAINKDQERVNNDINKQLKTDKKTLGGQVILLLLGAGESGKSTIAKQMKIIHSNGFSAKELQEYVPLIHQNTFGGIKTICTFMQEEGMKVAKKANRSVFKKVVSDEDYFDGEIYEQNAEEISKLWKDENVQKAYEMRSQYQLSDCVQYYLDDVLRIGSADFTPTEQDVLRSRAKTTGIIETHFEIEGVQFKLIDVGGQRSERKKWMSCFDAVTAVLFCVAMSEYDLTLEEDETTNRMTESITLFSQICNSKWFTQTSMILFLNKRDLFEEKLKKTPLTVCFADYPGGNNVQEATQWIGERFQEENKNKNQTVYFHATCATDTNNVKFVFNTVKDIVLNNALRDSGLRF